MSIGLRLVEVFLIEVLWMWFSSTAPYVPAKVLSLVVNDVSCCGGLIVPSKRVDVFDFSRGENSHVQGLPDAHSKSFQSWASLVINATN